MTYTKSGFTTPFIVIARQAQRSCEVRSNPEAIAETRRLLRFTRNDGLLLIKGMTNPDFVLRKTIRNAAILAVTLPPRWRRYEICHNICVSRGVFV